MLGSKFTPAHARSEILVKVKRSVPVKFQAKFISTAHATKLWIFSILTSQQIINCVIDFHIAIALICHIVKVNSTSCVIQ